MESKRLPTLVPVLGQQGQGLQALQMEWEQQEQELATTCRQSQDQRFHNYSQHNEELLRTRRHLGQRSSICIRYSTR